MALRCQRETCQDSTSAQQRSAIAEMCRPAAQTCGAACAVLRRVDKGSPLPGDAPDSAPLIGCCKPREMCRQQTAHIRALQTLAALQNAPDQVPLGQPAGESGRHSLPHRVRGVQQPCLRQCLPPRCGRLRLLASSDCSVSAMHSCAT